MKLYYSPGACSLAPHIALCEEGITFELEAVDLANKKTASGADYLTINPKGYVPTLQLDDGSRLTEASTLLQYLADQKPEAGLAPKPGSMERYRLMEWLNFIATEVHKGFGPLWNPTTPEPTKEAAKMQLAKRFDFVDAHLASNPYLLGNAFSVADAYLFTIVNWTNWHGIDLGKWPKLMEFMARVNARPQVQDALKAEGLLK